MPLVLDASVTACWCFADEHHPLAEATLDRIANDTAIVPAHWWFEIRNMLLMGERRHRISIPQSAEFLDWLRDLPISPASDPRDDEILELARAHRLTFYDAAYLDLARQMALPLATLDTRMAATARSMGVTLIEAG